MNAMEIQTHAQKLLAVHGHKALAEAAANARQYEKSGDSSLAQDWKRIEAALRSLKPPMAS